MPRPVVVQLRGHNTNVWDLRPLEALQDQFDVRALVTGSNLHDLRGLSLPTVPVRTPRDRLPAGRVAGGLAYAAGERYLGLERHLRGAAIVHAAELGGWFTAQAAALKQELGFKLVATAWETLPWRATYRWPRERRYRKAILPAVDLWLAATERARAALLLEGVDERKVRVSAPGVATERFAAARTDAPGDYVLAPGRLVWEKGHQDVLRAMAWLPAAERPRLLIVGDGPERAKLERYAAELGVAAELGATVPYDDMPGLYAGARTLVLASLPTPRWEEQFGMVLAEAMAAGTPIISTTCGAIPEVVGEHGALVAPGDWRSIARHVADPPPPAPPEAAQRYAARGVTDRTRAAYRELLA